MPLESVASALAVGLAKSLVTSKVKSYLARFPDPNTEGFKLARDEMFVDWFLEFREQSEQRFADLSTRIEGVEAKVAERGESVEAHGVYANYALQAYREPIAERRLMLAHAAAAIIDVRLTIAEHARVQRRIDEVDPDDVLTLYAVSRTYGRAYKGRAHVNEAHVRGALLADVRRGDTLVAAGCVQIRERRGTFGGSAEEAVVTTFGELLLQVMRSYCRSREVPFVIPGREVLDGERGRDAALAVLESLASEPAAFRKAVAKLALRDGQPMRYSAPHWNISEDETKNPRVTTPPHPHGAAWLELEKLTGEEAQSLQAFAPYDARQHEVMHGRPRQDVRVEAVKRGDDDFYARIHGPHDVLRHLADEVDCRWW